MPKIKKTKEVESTIVDAKFEPTVLVHKISHVEFADLNTLKDKLNEVITHLNR